MPFTLSHPLAVVPFARTGLIFSALVIGSMSPDFEYFVRLRQDSHASHTFVGLFTRCLPASLLVYWLWHALLKKPLLELAPEYHRARLAGIGGDFSFGPYRHFFKICASILLGAATHLLWDSHTHEWGIPVRAIVALQTKLSLPGLAPIPFYRCLQHASSILGLLGLLFLYRSWIMKLPLAEPPPGLIPPSRRTRILLTAAILAALVGLAMAARRFPLSDPENFRGFVVRSTVVSISALGVMALAFAFWFRRRFPSA